MSSTDLGTRGLKDQDATADEDLLPAIAWQRARHGEKGTLHTLPPLKVPTLQHSLSDNRVSVCLERNTPAISALCCVLSGPFALYSDPQCSLCSLSHGCQAYV